MESPLTILIRDAVVEDAAGMAKVHVDTWRTTYGGIVPDDFLANLRYERSQARWVEYLTHQSQNRSRSFVAHTETGQIVGITTGGVIREAVGDFDGELYGLYLLKEYQGYGTGRRLVQHVAQYLRSQGFH
jgi:GNAT superfamily N-acetyltransferase